MKKLSQAIVLASAMTAGLAAVHTAQAEVEVSASAAVASMYLWRGLDLGSGAPQVSGSLDVAAGGAYAGVWVGAGDTSFGNEYDLYAGFAGEAGDVSYDVGYATYIYAGSDIGFNEAADVYVKFGLGDASLAVYSNVTVDDGPGYVYMTLGYSMDAVSFNLGYNMDQDDEASAYSLDGADKEDFAHLDISYAVNDQLSFTVSQMVMADDGVASLEDQDTLVMLSYSLPVEL